MSAAAPLAFAAGAEREARKRVVDSYGKDFATKSSDAVCRYLNKPRREALSIGAPPPLILEFSSSLAAVELLLSLSRRDRISLRRKKVYRYASPIRMLLE